LHQNILYAASFFLSMLQHAQVKKDKCKITVKAVKTPMLQDLKTLSQYFAQKPKSYA